MTTQPEALRLADALNQFHNPCDKQAASELRRHFQSGWSMKPDQLTQDLAMIARNAIDLIRKLEREKHEAVLAEREACAKVCDAEVIAHGNGSRDGLIAGICAAAIRARTI